MAFHSLKCHKIPLTLNCTVAKPLKLPTIPFKTRKICQFRSLKCKKIWKIFLGTFSKYLLKIGDYRRFMHKIPLTPNCTVANPLKLPTIPLKTRNICQFMSLKCKKIFLGTFPKYFSKISNYHPWNAQNTSDSELYCGQTIKATNYSF